jgi:hypothetical protein
VRTVDLLFNADEAEDLIVRPLRQFHFVKRSWQIFYCCALSPLGAAEAFCGGPSVLNFAFCSSLSEA